MATESKSYADIMSELFARADELRPLAEEYVRIADALVALARAGEPEPEPVRKPRAKRAAGEPVAKRAPRGANKTALLVAITERPGATPGELAEATGIAKPIVYNALNQLVKRNEARAVELPSGGKGYALPVVTDAQVAAEAEPEAA